MMDSVGHYSRPELLTPADRPHADHVGHRPRARSACPPRPRRTTLDPDPRRRRIHRRSPEGSPHVRASPYPARSTSALLADLQCRRPRRRRRCARRARPPRRRRPVRPPRALARRRDGDGADPRARGRSPYRLRVARRSRRRGVDAGPRAVLLRDGEPGRRGRAARGAALLRARRPPTASRTRRSRCCTRADVLASTVLQSCIRYDDPRARLPVLRHRHSLKEGRTLARKTPAQLAEVAEAAVRLDGVEQLVLTTGTPATPDRGAAHLAACAAAVRAAVPALPIQVQCEPPDDFAWFERLHARGRRRAGHAPRGGRAERCARRSCPARPRSPSRVYLEAFAAAVAVFGRGQVSTYLIAGLGDRPRSLLDDGRARLARSASIRSWSRSCRSPARRWRAHAPPAGRDDARAVQRGRRACCARTACRRPTMKAGCAQVRRLLGAGVVRGGGVRRRRRADRRSDSARVRLPRGAHRRASCAAYFALRRAIFCDEQGLFDGSDRRRAATRRDPDRLPGRRRH